MPTSHQYQNRVASLLPALSQLLTELNAQDNIVACSHECECSNRLSGTRTPTIVTRPKLPCTSTSATANGDELSDGGVQVAAGWAAATNRAPPLVPDLQALTCAYYGVDLDALASTRPTLLLSILPEPSSPLAPTHEEITAALRSAIPSLRAVLHIDPATASEIAAATRTIATALGITTIPHFSLSPRITNTPTPTVAVLQWADPVYLAGAWIPEAVRNASGRSIHTRIGGASASCTVAQLAQYDIVVFAVCALGLQRCTKIARNFLAKHKHNTSFRRTRFVAVDATRAFTFATPAMFRETTEVIMDILGNRSNPAKWTEMKTVRVVSARR